MRRPRRIPILLVLLPCLTLVSGAWALDDDKDAAEAEARFSAGLAHLREGRAHLAVAEFERAVRLDKENPYLRKGYGQALAADGDFKEAIKQFEEALKQNPHFVDVRNDLGSALILSGRRSDGVAQFLQAYNDPTNPTPAITARNLGQAYLEQQSFDEALNWFRTSLNRNREYADAHLGTAQALGAMGRLDEAVRQLEAGVDAAPDSLALVLALGEAYYRAGRFADARPRLEEVARRDPSGPAGLRAGALLQKFP